MTDYIFKLSVESSDGGFDVVAEKRTNNFDEGRNYVMDSAADYTGTVKFDRYELNGSDYILAKTAQVTL